MNSSEKHECSWDGPSMAPSSGEPHECHEEVTVHHLGAEVGFCTHHYLLFDKGFGWQFPIQYAAPQLCEFCEHTAKEHEDRYGCEHDRGDHPGHDTVGAYALGPCGCKTFVAESEQYTGTVISELLDLVDEVERRVGL